VVGGFFFVVRCRVWFGRGGFFWLGWVVGGVGWVGGGVVWVWGGCWGFCGGGWGCGGGGFCVGGGGGGGGGGLFFMGHFPRIRINSENERDIWLVCVFFRRRVPLAAPDCVFTVQSRVPECRDPPFRRTALSRTEEK